MRTEKIKDDLYYETIENRKIRKDALFKRDILKSFEKQLKDCVFEEVEKNQSKTIERGFSYFNNSIYYLLIDYDYDIKLINKVLNDASKKSSSKYYDFNEVSKIEVASHLKKKYKQIVKTTIEDFRLYYEMYDKKRIELLNADKKAEIDKRFNESINRTIKENRKKEIKQAINKNAKKSINIFIIISMFFTTFLTNLDKKLHKKK